MENQRKMENDKFITDSKIQEKLLKVKAQLKHSTEAEKDKQLMDNFLQTVEETGRQRVNDAKKHYKETYTHVMSGEQETAHASLQNRKTELETHYETLLQKLKMNMCTENQNNEQALMMKRQEVQNNMKRKLQQRKREIEEDFEISKSLLLSESQMKLEN